MLIINASPGCRVVLKITLSSDTWMWSAAQIPTELIEYCRQWILRQVLHQPENSVVHQSGVGFLYVMGLPWPAARHPHSSLLIPHQLSTVGQGEKTGRTKIKKRLEFWVENSQKTNKQKNSTTTTTKKNQLNKWRKWGCEGHGRTTHTSGAKEIKYCLS